MNEIVLASNNAHKLEEFQAMFKPYGVDVLSLKQLNINIDVEENGSTFLENSLIKATEVKKFTDLPVVSDDSGLVVSDLNNEPGIYSARYSGENATDESNRKLLVKNIANAGLNNPAAYFVCAITFLDNESIQAEGKCHGKIIDEERGLNGFGYDPIFFVEEHGKTFAELSEGMKNAMSHRGKGLVELIKKLKEKNKINL